MASTPALKRTIGTAYGAVEADSASLDTVLQEELLEEFSRHSPLDELIGAVISVTEETDSLFETLHHAFEWLLKTRPPLVGIEQKFEPKRMIGAQSSNEVRYRQYAFAKAVHATILRKNSSNAIFVFDTSPLESEAYKEMERNPTKKEAFYSYADPRLSSSMLQPSFETFKRTFSPPHTDQETLFQALVALHQKRVFELSLFSAHSTETLASLSEEQISGLQSRGGYLIIDHLLLNRLGTKEGENASFESLVKMVREDQAELELARKLVRQYEHTFGHPDLPMSLDLDKLFFKQADIDEIARSLIDGQHPEPYTLEEMFDRISFGNSKQNSQQSYKRAGVISVESKIIAEKNEALAVLSLYYFMKVGMNEWGMFRRELPNESLLARTIDKLHTQYGVTRNALNTYLIYHRTIRSMGSDNPEREGAILSFIEAVTSLGKITQVPSSRAQVCFININHRVTGRLCDIVVKQDQNSVLEREFDALDFERRRERALEQYCQKSRQLNPHFPVPLYFIPNAQLAPPYKVTASSSFALPGIFSDNPGLLLMDRLQSEGGLTVIRKLKSAHDHTTLEGVIEQMWANVAALAAYAPRSLLYEVPNALTDKKSGAIIPFRDSSRSASISQTSPDQFEPTTFHHFHRYRLLVRGIGNISALIKRYLGDTSIASTLQEIESVFDEFSQPLIAEFGDVPRHGYFDQYFENHRVKILQRGEKKIFRCESLDLTSIWNLHAAVDAATFLCYGGYIDMSDLGSFARSYVRNYNKSIDHFNQVVNRFQASPLEFLLDELRRDFKSTMDVDLKHYIRGLQLELEDSNKEHTSPSLQREEIKKMFGTMEKYSHRKKNGEWERSYLRRLSTFMDEFSSPRSKFQATHNPHEDTVAEFTRQLAAAVFFRAYLVSGTVIGYRMANKDLSELWIKELIDTQTNALVALNRYRAIVGDIPGLSKLHDAAVRLRELSVATLNEYNSLR